MICADTMYEKLTTTKIFVYLKFCKRDSMINAVLPVYVHKCTLLSVQCLRPRSIIQHREDYSITHSGGEGSTP